MIQFKYKVFFELLYTLVVGGLLAFFVKLLYQRFSNSISNRENFSAIFIPLTFIAGIYGTNFEYLPELHFKYSYLVFWGVLVTVATSMIIYFRRKGWM